MNFLLENGINLIVAIQGLSWLEMPMQFFSFIGSEYFSLLLLVVIYWCIDSALGIRIGFILLFTGGLNDILKMAMRGPRPYWFSAQVKAFAAESSFGVPSGHAQSATVVWGTIANRFRKTWAWIAAIVVIFLIGLSRIFLAVHFPHDVLLGWILGALTLWYFIAWWNNVEVWVKQRPFSQQIFLGLAVSLLIVLLGGFAFYGLQGYVFPQEWMTNALRAGGPPPAPVSMNGTLAPAGAFFGMAVGIAWINRRGGYKASGPVGKRVLAFIIGLIGVLIIYVGLKMVFPADNSIIAYFLRYLRYALLGFWIAGGAPWLFFHFKIANPNL